MDSAAAACREASAQRRLMNERKATRTVIVSNPEGLHLRAAALLVQCARRFESHIEVIKKNQRADGKSAPLHLTALGAQAGEELVLEALGRDAEEAVDALAELIRSHFREDAAPRPSPE